MYNFVLGCNENCSFHCDFVIPLGLVFVERARARTRKDRSGGTPPMADGGRAVARLAWRTGIWQAQRRAPAFKGG